MENKLKTLEDFKGHIEESIHNRLCKDLKQEAIKWTNELWSNGTCGIGEENDNSDSMIAWIKHFFNITDADVDALEKEKE